MSSTKKLTPKERKERLEKFEYDFICEECNELFHHAPGIQDHLLEKHGIPIEESKYHVEAIRK